MEKVALKPDHQLMDPDFEGYKLSLDSVPIYQQKLDSPLEVRTASDDQFSFLHAKIFGATNLLVSDKFNPGGNNVYLLDVHREAVDQVSDHSGEGRAPEIVRVFTSPEAERPIRGGDYNPSLQFADESFAVFGDGRGVLFVLRTGNRAAEVPVEWTTAFHDEICGTNRPFVVTSAQVSTDEKGIKTLHALLQYVDDVDKIEGATSKKKKVDSGSSQFANVVEWIALTESCNSTFKLDRVRRFVFFGALDYLELDHDAGSLLCATDKSFEIIFDSEGLPEKEEAEEEKSENKPKVEKVPSFYWMQGVEDMVIWIMLPEGTTKRDLKVTLKPSEIVVKIGNEVKISGRLWNVLDGDSMTWTIQNGNKLEITACKAHEGLVWKRFLQDETVEDGEEVYDPAMVQQIHDQLSNLTTENPIDDGQARSNIYNAQELEDCDEALEINSKFFAVGEKNEGSVVNLSGRQWLFSLPSLEKGAPQRLCLRHDVDGLVWQPHSDKGFSMKHVGTFCALGYVQASKQQRKFSCAAPDLTFSAICDRTRHIYVYREPAPLSAECELRNRKSGKNVRHVAKQNVVTLDDANGELVGVQASNKTIFVATKSTIFTIRVNL